MQNAFFWYVARGEEQAGPFTNEQLRAHAEQGDLKPDDQVWRPGFEDWQRAGDVPGLLRPPARTSSPPPPPVPQKSSSTPPPLPKHVALEALTSAGDTPPDAKFVGVRGWLLFLCIQLTILSPLLAMGQIARLFEQIRPSFSNVAGLENFFVAMMVMSLVLVLASIGVGAMLWSRRPCAHVLAQRYLVLTFAWVCISPYTIYLFVRMPPGAVPGILVAALPELVMGFIVTFAWYSYLMKSKRVRANFGRATQRRVADSARVSTYAVETRSNPANYSSVEGGAINIWKIAGMLALIALACEVFLVLVVGPQSPRIQGYKYATAAQLGEEIGRWLFTFLVAALGAVIGRLGARKAPGDDPRFAPISGGILAALVATAMAWAGSNAERFVSASTKQDFAHAREPAPWVAPIVPPQGPLVAHSESRDNQKQLDADKIAALLNKVPNASAPQPSAPPTEPTKAKGPALGAPEGRDQQISASELAVLKSIISSRLRECWRLPSGAGGSDTPVVTLRWTMNRDGTLASDPQLERPRGDALFPLAAEAAIQAVKECTPFPLPQDKYTTWRTITWEFDPSQLIDARNPRRTERDLAVELRALGEPPSQQVESSKYFHDLAKRFGPSADGLWRRFALSEGIALEIPPHWIVTSDRERDAIDAFGKALFPSSTLKGRMGFGATLHAPDGKIVAQVGIRFYSDSAADDILETDIEAATLEEIRLFEENLRKGHELSTPKPSLWLGTRKAKTGAFSSLVSEYVARFAHEQFDRRFVRVRVYDGKLSFSLLLNYDESVGLAQRPTIDRIMSTLARAN